MLALPTVWGMKERGTWLRRALHTAGEATTVVRAGWPGLKYRTNEHREEGWELLEVGSLAVVTDWMWGSCWRDRSLDDQ